MGQSKINSVRIKKAIKDIFVCSEKIIENRLYEGHVKQGKVIIKLGLLVIYWANNYRLSLSSSS